MKKAARFFLAILLGYLIGVPVAVADDTTTGAPTDILSEHIIPRPADKPPGVIDQLKELPDQVPTPINTEKIDRAGEEIGLKLGEVGERISPFFGNWINTTLIWEITWIKLLSCLLLLMLVFAAERALRFFINRWLRHSSSGSDPPSWEGLFVRGMSKPLSLFLWAYGTYGSLSPLFPHLARPGLPEKIHLSIIWATDMIGSVAALWFLYRLLHLANFQMIRWAGNQKGWLGHMIVGLAQRYSSPMKLLAVLIFCRLISPLFGFGPWIEALIGQVFGLMLIAAISWLIIQTLHAGEEVILSHYRMDVEDNLAARKMHTQIQFLKRMTITLVLVLAGGSMLMLFEKVRQLGTSILASAGIIGIVVGLAAQRSISNILVGLQIALTQPIRLDDVVIVENEWGRIEEITTTYVVVKLWDLRRLIVPTSYFTEKPFQNWTRGSTELLGTVFLYTDYTIPVVMVRERLRLILAESNWWNGKVGEVHVTNTSAQGMELRILVSADNAGAAWDLRCQIREQMITFLQERYPRCLPRIRTELQPLAATDPELPSRL